MIDLAALASLTAVDAHGSVVGAAQSLGFTPSAVSQQVKRLERQAGVPLLERVGRGVMLTRHGRHLVDEGSRLLADLEAIETSMHRQAGAVGGHLRLAAFSTATRGLLAPVMRSLRDEHPELELSMVEREPWDTVDLVAAGRCDLGIVHRWGDVPLSVPAHLIATTVAQDLADVIVHRDHRFAGRRQVRPRDLVDEPWIATPEITICRQWLGRMFDGTGRRPHVVHESTEFDSHLALVRAGLGVALVPRLGRSPLGHDLVAVRVHDPVPTREILAVHRRTMAGSPTVRAVLAAIAQPEVAPASSAG